MKSHLALVHLDLFIGVCLPGKLLQLLCCVLTCLQVGLDDILSNTVWETGFISLVILLLQQWKVCEWVTQASILPVNTEGAVFC